MRKKISVISLILVLAITSVFVMAVPASAAATKITLLSPTTAYPAISNQGGQVEITATLDVSSADFYQVEFTVTNEDTNVCGEYSDLMYLNAGTTTIARMVTIMDPDFVVGSTVYLDVTVGLTDFDAPTTVSDATGVDAIMLMDVPGSAIATTIISKVTILAEAVLDKFVSPSKINDTLISGSAFDALNDEGKSIVDGVGSLGANGIGMAGEIVQGIRATVSTRVPTVVNGALSVVAEIVGLFSSMTPWAP